MDPPRLKLALAQINTTVGDIDGNAAKIVEWAERARDEAGADLAVFPELCIPGYPAEDLYLKRHFLDANRQAVDDIAAKIGGIAVLVGFAEPLRRTHGPQPALGDAPRERCAANSLALLSANALHTVYRKHRLPNYGVFDEFRYFEPGSEPVVAEIAGVSVGLTICEDAWAPGPPASSEAERGARLIVNASASPYHRGKGIERERMFCERAREYGAAFAFCNLVGGQDELVFDGHSFIVDDEGKIVARAPQFEEGLLVCDLGGSPAADSIANLLTDHAEVYAALTLGLRDYVEKNRFERVVLALSGGIDSALVALLAVDALGPERVSCVVMPSPHSSAETQADARTIVDNLGCELIEIPIEDAMQTYRELLADSFARHQRTERLPDPTRRVPGLAEENIQARIRGNLVMALSNRFGWLVLTTGNKSEMSVGYATLYGDMAGGFAVIKDVPKTFVYELVRHRNEVAGRELIPSSVIERAPSAELRPGQRDEDSLPPYAALDPILAAYVERDEDPEQIVESGAPERTVREVVRLVDRAEYKRRQAPPGIRISTKAFGRDRRLPITNRFGA